MTGFREFVAIALVECLMPLGFPQQSQAMATAERGEEFRLKVEQLGAGAEVRVMLKDPGKEIRGTVESFDDSAFRLRPGGTGEQKTVRYAEVTWLAFAQRKYSAKGSSTSDATTVRRVAVELGIGRKVQVRTRDSNTLVGRIVKSDADQLYLKIGEGGPVSICYAQITELKPKQMSGLVKAAIGVGVTFGILIVAAAALCGSGGCS